MDRVKRRQELEGEGRSVMIDWLSVGDELRALFYPSQGIGARIKVVTRYAGNCRANYPRA
jgi:hypothetical protein